MPNGNRTELTEDEKKMVTGVNQRLTEALEEHQREGHLKPAPVEAAAAAQAPTEPKSIFQEGEEVLPAPKESEDKELEEFLLTKPEPKEEK